VESIQIEWDVFGDCADLDTVDFLVQVEVANFGSAPAGPFYVAIGGSQSRPPIDLAQEGLAAGESLSIEIAMLPGELGGAALDQKQLIVAADPFSEVRESNENNNTSRNRPELPVEVQLCATPEPNLVVAQVLDPISLLPAGQPLSFQRIDMIDANRGWGIVGEGDRDQHIVRTEDGGWTWIDISPPELTYGAECGDQAILQTVDASTAWVAYLNADGSSCRRGVVRDFWKTEDGGRTWRFSSFVQGLSAGSGGDNPGFPVLEFVDSQYGWAHRAFFAGEHVLEDDLYQTTDGGRTWVPLPEAYLGGLTGLDFLDLKHGWATTYSPFTFPTGIGLAQTHNGGSGWEYGELPLPGAVENYRSCFANSPSLRSSVAGQVTVRCSTQEGEEEWFRYETSDGGQTWQIRALPLQPDQFVSASVGWRSEYAHEQEGTVPNTQTRDLYWTYDGGQSWSKVGTVTLIWGTDFDFVSAQMGWAVARISDTENELIQTIDGGRTWQPVHPVTVDWPFPDQRGEPPRIATPAELQPLTSQTAGDLELLQEVPAAGVTALAAYAPYGQLLTSHQDGTVTVWDLIGGDYPKVVRLHSDWVYDLAVAEQAELFATASKDGRLRLWESYRYFQIESATLTPLEGEVSSVAATSDGNTFASAGQDGVIRIWEPDEISFDSVGLPVAELLGHGGWVWDLALSPDGRILASGSVDRTIRLWDLMSGESVETLPAHSAAVGALAFSPTGGRMASAAWDGSVVLWDTETWQPLRESGEHSTRVYSVSFSLDGSLFATGADNGVLILWSAESGEPLRTLQVGEGAVRAVLFTPDGQSLMTGSDDGFLRLWGVRP
jgi:WD40 repeat protein